MSKQLDLLVGSGLPVSELDVYVLMNRTRQIYELVCSVETAGTANTVGSREAAKPEEKAVKRKAETKKPEPVEVDFVKNEEPFLDMEPAAEPVEVVEAKPEPKKKEEVDIVHEIAKPEPAPQKQTDEPKETVKKTPRKVEPQVAIAQQPDHLTIADKMAQHEDDSLAARLQRKSINDLKAAIGINEKFLFVNELFAGSMEKYNKSINLLNEVSTLEGAKVCLDELKIELQWSSNSEAYNKLKELVVRRFEVQ